MKMTLKGIFAAAAFWVAYINENFTPLFWVLLVLVLLDLVLNAHKEGQQFSKIGSMAVSIGLPSTILAHVTDPNLIGLAKYIVAALCLVYLQIVVPALMQKIASLKTTKDPKQNSLDQAKLDALVQSVEALTKAQADKELKASGIAAPTIIQDGGEEGK